MATAKAKAGAQPLPVGRVVACQPFKLCGINATYTYKTSVGFTGSKLDARSCCWFIHSFQDPIAAANVPLTPAATPLTTPPASTSAAATLPAKARPPAPSAAPAPPSAAASSPSSAAAVPVVDLVEQDWVF